MILEKGLEWIKGLGIIFYFLHLDPLEGITEIVLSKMVREEGVWKCLDCSWQTQYKTRLFEHVEAKHVETDGYFCKLCDKHLPSIISWKQHKSKFHK